MPKGKKGFQKGRKRTGGRTKGTPNHGGLQEALNIVAGVWDKEKNRKLFAIAIQKEFEKDPIKYFERLNMPLLPKNVNVKASVTLTDLFDKIDNGNDN